MRPDLVLEVVYNEHVCLCVQFYRESLSLCLALALSVSVSVCICVYSAMDECSGKQAACALSAVSLQTCSGEGRDLVMD